jgi:uncharacterized damage-inducible protein DinB
MHPRIKELVGYLDTQRAALLAAASALPSSRWTEQPAPGRWSVAELLEHLQIVERSCAAVIAKRANEARASGHPPETATSSKLEKSDPNGLLDRSKRLDAPARVAPTGALSADDALAGLERSRTELNAAIAVADGLALESIRHTHRFGELDLYQWIQFVGQHEARHVAQMAEIVRDLGATPAVRS